MNDWPSEEGMFWLILGLLPVGYVIRRVQRRGADELANLSFAFVIITWLGYHSTPWLALRIGGWDGFLLRPDYVTDGLIFSTLGMVAFLVGYRRKEHVNPRSRLGGLTQFRQMLVNSTPRVRWIIVLAVISILLFLINIGGINEFWQSTRVRGEGQFDERTVLFRVRNIIQIVVGAIHYLLALVSALALFSAVKPGIQINRVAGLLGLVIASLPAVHAFSRAAGLSFVIAAFVAVLLRGWKKALPIVLVFSFLGGWLGWTGYTQRGKLYPGISTFFTAMIAPAEAGDAGDGRKDSIWDDPELNPLNALDAFTARAWSKEFVDTVSLEDGLLGLFAALQPIPSQVVPFEVMAGESLAKIFGTEGTVGLTTPALAELYYWFGLAGVLPFILFGRLCRWIDRRRRQSPSLMAVVLWLGTILGMVIGLHGGVRAMTRFTIYALIIMGLTHAHKRKRIRLARTASAIPINFEPLAIKQPPMLLRGRK